MVVHLKRIYEAPSNADGVRILVDRIWPRGISKEKAQLDEWLKEIAPSHDLRKWFAHDVSKFPAFAEKYKGELKQNDEQRTAFLKLKQIIQQSEMVTLLYAAKDEEHNQAQVLKQYIENDGG
ncbi:DUF488 domain-containing protein [Virgibacillus soli]|uniref:DUF488 domain-containing protein n=1 Tax=Paracerasibacillus soli TaxID=480284 RepID=A0ABU5CUM6_9BACI|nr:DUF488 domain-containing protein [Virgibacillus soli]MDY0409542.1 DUF488 domain-containing protein [Virgibacillus soli]